MLFIPLKAGETPPQIAYDENSGVAVIDWGDQKDAVTFSIGADNRTTLAVNRGGVNILPPLTY